MNKKIIAGVLMLALATMACSINFDLPTVNIGDGIEGSGNMLTQERSVSNFDQVELRSYGKLTITQGDTESLTIEAEDNLIDHLTSEVQDGKLILGAEENFNLSDINEIRYTLTVKNLSQVSLAGFGDIQIDSIQTDQMTVNLSGSGNLEMDDLEAESLEVNISGFGMVKVNGSAPDQAVTITGSGNYAGEHLDSVNSKVVISGFGNASVRASETLDVKITGSGNVDYYGSPDVTQTITGFGKLTSKGSR